MTEVKQYTANFTIVDIDCIFNVTPLPYISRVLGKQPCVIPTSTMAPLYMTAVNSFKQSVTNVHARLLTTGSQGVNAHAFLHILQYLWDDFLVKLQI